MQQACMKEAMRMHPGVSFPLERVVQEGGAELCGHYMPLGTIVGTNAAVVHRDRAVFGVESLLIPSYGLCLAHDYHIDHDGDAASTKSFVPIFTVPAA
ncbi:hypothetical protein SLS55_010291 [Diplodia seriata]|uniref:Uncharacterized protein n=1 Tax=Diplodia seriata TaxID=420778 RepID=A0ABR3BY45_9PEZI